MPAWMTNADYVNWGKDFYKTFESEFSAITGIAAKELAAGKITQGGRYFGKNYSTEGKGWQKYLESLKAAPAERMR
jgi:hypothetical protein